MTAKVTETLADGGTVVTETRTVNALNQVTANSVVTVTTSPAATTTVDWVFEFDLNGNMTSRSDGTDTTTYGWDEQNRLMLVTLPDSSTVAYSYDGGGRMLSRDSAGVTTFQWDSMNCIQEIDSSGIVTRYYIPQNLMLSFDRSVEGSVSAYQVHRDAVGSVRKITDSSGVVVANFDTDAWGNLLPSTYDSVDHGGFWYRYVGTVGVRHDAATALVYMRQRWYDPTLGQFVSSEPITSQRSYAYSYNNPVCFIDPTGLDGLTLEQLLGRLAHDFYLPAVRDRTLKILASKGVDVTKLKIRILDPGPDLLEDLTAVALELKKLGPLGYRSFMKQLKGWVTSYGLKGCTVKYYTILHGFDIEAASQAFAKLIIKTAKARNIPIMGTTIIALLALFGSSSADAAETTNSGGSYGNHPIRNFLFPHAEELLQLNAHGGNVSLPDVLNAVAIDILSYYKAVWAAIPAIEYLEESNDCHGPKASDGRGPRMGRVIAE